MRIEITNDKGEKLSVSTDMSMGLVEMYDPASGAEFALNFDVVRLRQFFRIAESAISEESIY
jgi:hypothetical protein